jgi:hypothetical protein
VEEIRDDQGGRQQLLKVVQHHSRGARQPSSSFGKRHGGEIAPAEQGQR